MANRIFIGIDLGTTTLKAAAFDATSGRALGSASRRLAVHTDVDGTREQDPAALRGVLGAVFAELRTGVGEDAWRRVAGIGLGAQGGSGALVARATGEAFTPMMLWNDTRSAGCAVRITAQKPDSYWPELALRQGPGIGLARLVWLRERHPERFDADHLYVGAGELAYHAMTGVWRQDACNALQIGCYNVPADRLDAEPLALAGVSLDFVAPLRRGHETHPISAAGATLLGLPAGLPVAGPYMDHEAGYMSAAGISERPLQCSLGTAWVGNFIVRDEHSGRSPIQLVIPAPVGSGRLVIQPLLTGNVAWDWGLATFLDPDHGRALRQLDAVFDAALLPRDGLVALSWLTHAHPLLAGASGGGVLVGLNAHSDPHECLRAVAASLVCEFTRVFRNVQRHGAVDSVVLGGGASKGRFFRTMLAGLFAPLPVFSLADEDLAGARGTLFAFSPSTARSNPIPVPCPDTASRERLERAFANYCAVHQALYGHIAAGGPYIMQG